MISYLEHLCDGRSSLIADVVVLKSELFDGGVFLSEIDQKDTVGGVLNGLKTIAQIMQKVKSKFVGNARV